MVSYTVGAERGDVLRVVFASTLVSVGSGMLAGLALTLALNRILEKWEGNARDPVVLLAGTMLLIVVSRIAYLIPVDPSTALRCD